MSVLPTGRVGDRLASTLFLAALAHGVIILGVTFGSLSFSGDKNSTQALNVTLVVDTNRVEPPPDDSDLLAQIDSRGHGSLAKGQRPTAAPAGNQVANRKGTAGAAGLRDGKPREAAQRAQVVMTRNPSSQGANGIPKAVEQAAATPEAAAAMLTNAAPPTLAAEIDDKATNPKQYDRELIASPATRKSILAAYLENWRRHVERIGTANFPEIFRGRHMGNPVLEVAIGASGQLADIIVKRSSGDGEVDQAALNILRMAAPFDPLPAAIREKYDVLRFAYEWQFTGGGSAGNQLSANKP